MNKFYVYVLRCSNTPKFYVGQTNNIIRRLSQHISGYSTGFTAEYKPLEIIAVFEAQTRSGAMKLENLLQTSQEFCLTLATGESIFQVLLDEAPNCSYLSIPEFIKVIPVIPFCALK